jgi:endonuclease/exonuclease/phosphatase family metal-dependent hydrolase
MNFEEESFYCMKNSLTFYHPLCDLDIGQIKNETKDHLLSRKDSEVRILTYNIFLRSLVKNNESDWKDERLEDFLTLIHDYDIICLQEMFGTLNNRKQTLIRAATIAGFFFFVDTASPSFFSRYMVEGGLVILSRFPIISFSSNIFRYGVIQDSLAQKGILYAKILIKNSFLHLFTTHTQASYFDIGENNFIASYKTRLDQITQINKIICKILEVEYNKLIDKVILVGDLNVDGFSYKHKYSVYFS